MDLKNTLTDIINEIITEEDIFLVDIVITERGKLRIIVIIDGDKGINIDRCATLSRQLGGLIEERNLIEDAYLLEVSSPGIEQALKFVRQYRSNIGRRVKVELNDGSIQIGKLEAVAEEKITIAAEPKEEKDKPKKKNLKEENYPLLEISLSEIKKTNVLVSL